MSMKVPSHVGGQEAGLKVKPDHSLEVDSRTTDYFFAVAKRLSLVPQRHPMRRVNHEFIKLSGAIYDLKITKEMRTATTSARAKYMQFLEIERSKEKTETKSSRGRNRFFKAKENVPPNGHAPNN
ncbi:hypothetical protein AVEN_135257-1 [Araneus ventricosus]|uniref:Uncharacterized protein n=1 Tax=Araneus ventricosus TaxID=182803 RepID=A0A4Y2CQ40_ARAVE|nr:hypothetical protein AVEN_135257-1 [Araneus ventricosus]